MPRHAADPTRAAIPASLAEGARLVLGQSDPAAKAARAIALGAAAAAGTVTAIGAAGAPDRPARPERPRLVAPRHMARRRAGQSQGGRVALVHALAHIEFNAIDLAFDVVARFADAAVPARFFADWVRIGAEEAAHFRLLAGRLADLGAAYGDLPAHDGLWEAAAATADDLLTRLAVVPLVLEARGLDVTPAMIARMRRAGDDETARILGRILDDEIGHVAVGRRWFAWLARSRGLACKSAWRDLVARRFNGALKPPFNDEARGRAGFGRDWYGWAAGDPR